MRRAVRGWLANEAGKQVGNLLAEQHRVVEVIQATQTLQNRRQARHTSQLSGLQGLKHVQHLLSRDSHQLVVGHIERGLVAGMVAVAPIRYAPPHGVELDTGSNDVAEAGHFKLVMGDKLRR
ncbi:hypothetical protein D3C80_594940 [compost metagenome]